MLTPPNATSRRHVRPTQAIVGCGAVGLAALACIPFVDTPLPPNPSFMPAFGALTCLGDLLTCILLFSQASAGRDRSLRALGVAYLFSVLCILPHLAAFPGTMVAGSLIGTSASAVWLWCLWHAGFALLVLRYALLARHPATDAFDAEPLPIWPSIAIVAAVVAGFTTLATAGVEHLPTIIVGTGFGRLNALGIGPAVILCNVAALATIIHLLRGRTALAQWLTIAVTASTFDVILTLMGAVRYTLGWYTARLLGLTTGVLVLVALLIGFARLYAKTAAANRDLEALSLTDGLTSLPNRRAFDRTLDREWSRAYRNDDVISALILDIDHFKSFNDRFGHQVGDLCLRRVAQVIAAETRRGSDLPARFGGEEFAVILPGTGLSGARSLAEVIRRSVERLDLRDGGQSLGIVTISVGCASRSPMHAGGTAAALIKAADDALYEAKHAGRNQVAFDPASLTHPELPPISAADLAARLQRHAG